MWARPCAFCAHDAGEAAWGFFSGLAKDAPWLFASGVRLPSWRPLTMQGQARRPETDVVAHSQANLQSA